jgi:hypothetical protein
MKTYRYKTRKFQEEYEARGLSLNSTKTKYLSIRKFGHNLSLCENDTIKHCDNYKYLDLKINEGERHDSRTEIRINLGQYTISTMNNALWEKVLHGKLNKIFTGQ